MPYVLYRAIRRPQPSIGDFWSDYAHGEEPVPNQLRQPLMWCGVSMFSDVTKAKDLAERWMQGRFLAELNIPDDADVYVLQTGRDPLHHSVMGTPATLRSLVAHVLPISETNA
jgi:hypothetical protein